jgi:hypothetical protein
VPDYETKTVEVPLYGKNEGDETLLFVVPRNSLLANAIYTPAGEVRGDYLRSRSLTLRAHSEHRTEPWPLAGARLSAQISHEGPGYIAPGPSRLSLLPQCYGAGLPLAHHRQDVGIVLEDTLWAWIGWVPINIRSA